MRKSESTTALGILIKEKRGLQALYSSAKGSKRIELFNQIEEVKRKIDKEKGKNIGERSLRSNLPAPAGCSNRF